MISFHSCYTVRCIIIINIIVIIVVTIIYCCYRMIVISWPHYLCVVWLISIIQQKKRLVQLAVLYGWHYQNKSKFFFFVTTTLFSPPPLPPPLHTEIVVQFYPWSKFYFLLFQTPYHTLPYPKAYLPWQQSTLVVDSGDSLFLTSRGPLSPTVNSPNNPTTGRINKSSKQDPCVALCCSLVFV